MPSQYLYANADRVSPHGILKPTYRLATPAVKAVEVFLSSPETMPLHHLRTNVHRERPYRPSKRLLAPRSAVACRLFSLLQKQCHYITSIQTYIEKAPICSKTDFWPCGGRRPESDPADGGFWNR